VAGTIVVNRWHDNVANMFSEEDRLDPTRDSADFIEGSSARTRTTFSMSAKRTCRTSSTCSLISTRGRRTLRGLPVRHQPG